MRVETKPARSERGGLSISVRSLTVAARNWAGEDVSCIAAWADECKRALLELV